MNSRKNYEAPVLEIFALSKVDVITASFTENVDPGQGEWDDTEEVKIW